jgi:hypothetical protein
MTTANITPPNELASSEFLTIIQEDPVAAAELCQTVLADVDKGFRAELYVVLAAVYRIAHRFSSDQQAWARFRKGTFWEKCKKKKPVADASLDEIIMWVARFTFRAAKTNTTRYNRAYKHARTLQRYAHEDVAEEAVAEKLADEKPDYVFRLEVEEHPRRPKRGEERKSGTGRRAQARTADSNGRASRASQSISLDEDLILHVETTEEQLDQVLGLPVGGRAKIVVSLEENTGSWKRIVAQSVKILTDD